jgi:anti-sigma factor RsiW
MKCCEARAYLEAYADAELCTERALDVEAHLSDCRACQTELAFSKTVCSLTRSACTKDECSPDFKARLASVVHEESSRREQHRLTGLPLSWSAITPLAAAAAAAFWFNYSTNNKPGSFLANRAEIKTDVMNAATGPEQLFEALLQHHRKVQQPRFTDSLSVSNLEPELGLPVHAPDLGPGVRFMGANLVNVRSAPAASLYYAMGSHRVTIYVYDPEKLPLRTLRDLHPRVIGDRAMFVGQRHGYSVAACEDEGVGYAVAADMGEDVSTQLLAALSDDARAVYYP